MAKQWRSDGEAMAKQWRSDGEAMETEFDKLTNGFCQKVKLCPLFSRT